MTAWQFLMVTFHGKGHSPMPAGVQKQRSQKYGLNFGRSCVEPGVDSMIHVDPF